MLLHFQVKQTSMENKTSQSLGKMLLFLLLASIVIQIHCGNISLDDLPLVPIRQTEGERSCIEERQEDSCEANIYFPAVKAARYRQENKICFTDTNQSYFNMNGSEIEHRNATDCEISSIQDAVNLSRSCSWLRNGLQKTDESQTLLFVGLRCNRAAKEQRRNGQICLIFANSQNFPGSRDDAMVTCLHSKRSSGTDQSANFLGFIKKHMIVILASFVGCILLIIIAVLTNCIRKQFLQNKNESSETEPELTRTREDTVYHEPDTPHTYIDIDEASPKNYAYAYGHLGPLSPGRGGPGEKQDYMNIEQCPDERKNTKDYINVDEDDIDSAGRCRQEPGGKQDYMNIEQFPDEKRNEKDDENIAEDNLDYMEMKSGYQSLDRSNMVSDDAMYQGLVKPNCRVRPQIAPKPRNLARVDESCEISYVKVL